MKPLELTVYPLGNGGHGVYIPGIGCLDCHQDRTWDSKRLTDAELAAEHHSAVLDVYRARVHGMAGPDWDDAIKRMQTILRFATLPHFDEEPEP